MAANETVDPATLSDEEIKNALSHHCHIMGSRPDYYADEVERWKKDSSCLHVFRDRETGRLRAYTKSLRE
jgi:pentose-5-phosphate-3-epimerase